MESSPQSCTTCKKATGAENKPLQKCGRCKNTWYCSRECQKNDWPIHKWECNPEGVKIKVVYRSLIPYFKQLEDEKTTYKQLIDCFRLRCHDDYVFGKHTHGIYAQRGPLPYFNDFLNRAETAGILPGWWNPEKRKECVNMALTDDWASIKYAVEKGDISDHYPRGPPPMIFRMLAENVYGGGHGLGQRPFPSDFKCHCGGVVKKKRK